MSKPDPNPGPCMGMARVKFRTQTREETGEYRVLLEVYRNGRLFQVISLPVQGIKNNYRHIMDLEEKGYTPVKSVKVKANSEEDQR